jgi:hypothetical protein
MKKYISLLTRWIEKVNYFLKYEFSLENCVPNIDIANYIIKLFKRKFQQKICIIFYSQ